MSRWARATTVALAVGVLTTAVIGCSGRRGRGERPMITRDAGGLPGIDAGTSGEDAGGGGEDAGPVVEEIRGCYEACTSVMDCVGSSSLHDADNFECIDGICEWRGCNDDLECMDGLSGDYLCVPTPEGRSGCYQACETVSDCIGGSTLHDADNFECTDGVCQWQGCNDDLECMDGLSGDYVCASTSTGRAGCFEACDTATDCIGSSTLHDVDNFECNDGICEWQGCNDDLECMEGLSGDYLCRAP